MMCEKCEKVFEADDTQGPVWYTSDGQGPMCFDCSSEIEAELEAEEAETLYRGVRI